MPCRVLVTGANGFVGRALIETLHDAGYEVVGAYRDAGPEVFSYAHEQYVGEVHGRTDWRKALSGCDVVVHLAARAHIMRETAIDPIAAFRTVNTEGTLNLARQAVEAGVKRFILASTIKVNGEGRDRAYDESDSPEPQDPYATSKWEAESGLRDIARLTGLEVVILRFPLVYGPRVGGNFLRLLKLVDRGLPMPFGCLKNRRSLIYLSNLTDAIRVCITHPKAVNKTFLISDSEDTSTPELIRQLAAVFGRSVWLIQVPVSWLRFIGNLTGKNKEMDRLLGSLWVDSTAIRRDLDWVPPYSMKDGLAATVAWFNEQKIMHRGIEGKHCESRTQH